jgi:hypothetical protein
MQVAAAGCAVALCVSACGAGGNGQIGSAQISHPAAAAAQKGGGGSSGAASPAPVAPASPTTSSPASPTASASPSGPSQYLGGLDPVAGSGALFNGAVNVNGNYYANSIFLALNPGPQNVSYNLERQWHWLDATVGLTDDSSQNEKVQFQAIADGRTIYSHVFMLGQSQQVSLDVAGVLRLELVATLASNYVGPVNAAWGNASLTN